MPWPKVPLRRNYVAKLIDELNMNDIDPDNPSIIPVKIDRIEETTVTPEVDAFVGMQAERFVDLVKAGEPAWKAAQSIGTTVSAINTSEDMKKAIDKLLTVAEVSAEVRRKMVRAGVTKIFMETVNAEDNKTRKIALEAAKLIGQDPEVATNQETGVIINLGELEGVTKIGLELPGIKGPNEKS